MRNSINKAIGDTLQDLIKGERMIKFKKFEVEIGTNGHIKLNDKVIALLGAWNKLEELEGDILDELSENLHQV